MPAGEAFPSVRELSQALKINPNTAHKVVAELVRVGLLEVLPGVGTVVSASWRASEEERRALLDQEIERLVVEARRLGLSHAEVTGAVERWWHTLFGAPGHEAPRS
jgi:GntR family transcriptional regulator